MPGTNFANAAVVVNISAGHKAANSTDAKPGLAHGRKLKSKSGGLRIS
jgi:hypothetical protein